MAKTKGLLEDLVKVEGVTAAVIVARDGFVIDGVSNRGNLETETVGAVISAGTGSSEVMGRELQVGTMTQGMMEFSDGLIIMSLVGLDAILAVVADIKANLGYVRFQIKKRIPEIAKAL
ncbi:MAG TPA: roadblock/LC7 domain-containing protein [Geobacteraceae bacterium]|nr:roadblock/LC7 domain-containing protein [Geobacteraceae bacterium]